MTAIVCVCQSRHNLAHIVTDAAMYVDGQGVTALGSKTTPISHWGALTVAGASFAVPLFAWELGKAFANWDEMVGAAGDLPKLAETVKAYGLSHATVVLAGVSASRGAEAYTFQTSLALPPGVTEAEARANPYFQEPFALVKLPNVIQTPVPGPEMALAAGYEGIDVDADPEQVIWGMRKLLLMQRTMPLPDNIGGIGGWGELVTVGADGITQRVIERWPDKVGGKIHPAAVDWKAFNRTKPGVAKLRTVK